MEIKKLQTKIVEILEDKKAEEVTIFDVSDRDYIASYVIIATALVGRHTMALLDTLKTELKKDNVNFFATDENSEDWVIADLGEIFVHIFTPNTRARFNLEEFLQTLPKKTN